jgi:hypothetical protein
MTEIDSTLDPFVEAETSRNTHARNCRDWDRHLSLVDMGRTASLIANTTRNLGWNVRGSHALTLKFVAPRSGRFVSSARSAL